MKYPLLAKVKEPSSLQTFSLEELDALASEVRSRIIDVLSVNGGHLSSNLGSIEFTIALHYAFHSPKDKLIFDVSHQSYTHKLLTGRNDDRFDKIRKAKGLSGFAHPKESPHDHFFAGHAGTALSLGLGLAAARDLIGAEEHIIPIIGDATLTCGLTLEALNNINPALKRFIIILNDNAMSISHNVGGITHILRGKAPHAFFERFGLAYSGPVDGHDIRKLVMLLCSLKNASQPVIIHLCTKKGYGLDSAEKDPITFHGVKPFDPKTCEFLPAPTTRPTFPKIFGREMVKMGEKDPTLCVVTPAMSLGSCLDPFMSKFKERSWDVGIAEGHAVTFAGALAHSRRCKVVCSIYATFLQRALDNLFQDVCLQSAPVVFALDRAALAPSDGATHHGIYDIAFLKTMPNMVICQPRDGHLLKELLHACFSWGLPTTIRYPNIETEERSAPLVYRPLGKAEMLKEGSDVLIIALGHMCTAALKVCEMLSAEGIEAAVMDPIFVKPLDAALLSHLLLSHQKVVTIEEHALKGGLGAEVNHFIATHGFSHVQILNFAIPEAFFDHGDYSSLLDDLSLSPQKIAKKILSQLFSCHLSSVHS